MYQVVCRYSVKVLGEAFVMKRPPRSFLQWHADSLVTTTKVRMKDSHLSIYIHFLGLVGCTKCSIAGSFVNTAFSYSIEEPWIPGWFLDISGCNGAEESILQCGENPLHPFPRVCYDELKIGCALSPGNGTFGNVRLAEATQDSHVIVGRLEFFNEHWGSVCTSYFDDTTAKVTCRQLGLFDQGRNRKCLSFAKNMNEKSSITFISLPQERGISRWKEVKRCLNGIF